MYKFKLLFVFIINIFIVNADLENLLDVYNPGRIANILINNSNNTSVINISKICENDMNIFSEALINGKLWAAKMSDASGRYSSNFLWGNNFWLGSADLCKELSQTVPPPPPHFQVAFSIAKISLQLNNTLITPTPRTLHVGMCLPMNCAIEDVQSIFEFSVNITTAALASSNSRNLTILKVRSPDLDTFKYWQDPTFIILATVSTLVFALMCGGSAYDLYLRHQSRKQGLTIVTSMRMRTDDIETSSTESCAHCCVKPTNNGAIALDVIASRNKMQNGVKECNGNHAIDSYATQDATMEHKICDSETDSETSKNGRFSWAPAVLLCFSVPQNSRSIFDRSVGGDTLATLHGLRFLSMVWVILGHSCIVAFKYSDNSSFRGVVEKEFLFQTISNAAFSVDTFFFISGLLFSFLYFRTSSKLDINVITRATGLKSKVLQVVGLMMYRFGRLTAPYLYVLGVVQISMRWFYHKGIFEPPTLDYENCPKYWWRNALYINTLFPVKDMCMLWSWYLADDTQFYVLGSILMIIAVTHFRTAASMFVTFMVSSWCTTAYIAYTNNHQPSMDDPLALFDKIYDKPWTRLGPYLVGMATGWLLYNIDCKLKTNRGGIALGWALCSATLLSLLYGLYDAKLDAYSSAAYSSLSHTAWALGCAWVIVACSTGNGGYVTKILSAPILYPLSRVTYCAYLVHPLVIRAMIMYVDTPLHLARTTVTLLFLGHLVSSYIIAFVISLAFEAPVVALLRIVNPNKKEKSSH